MSDQTYQPMPRQWVWCVTVDGCRAEEAFPEDECPRCGRPLKKGLCPPCIRDIG